jgi:hypothetical protein
MKTLGGFALRFTILFTLLVCPWPGTHSVFSACFRAQTRFLVGAMLPSRSFRVETYSNPRHPTVDILVVLAGRNNDGAAGAESAFGIPFDSASQGWIPFAMWIALILATPLPWSKRLKALAVGSCVIELLVAATILVSVQYTLVGNGSSAWPRLPLMFANRLLVENIWFSFVPPFLLWAGWIAWAGHWEQLAAPLCGKAARVSAPGSARKL